VKPWAIRKLDSTLTTAHLQGFYVMVLPGLPAKLRQAPCGHRSRCKATKGSHALALLVIGKHGIRFHIPAGVAPKLKDAPVAMRTGRPTTDPSLERGEAPGWRR
jgi:hypothetical protein